MNMKIWRISIITSAIITIMVFLYIVISVLTTGNYESQERLFDSLSYPLSSIYVLCISVFIFVLTLIAFPCFIYKCIPFFIIRYWLSFNGREYLRSKKSSLVSLILCLVLISLLLSSQQFNMLTKQ
jgi:hypothetical protein